MVYSIRRWGFILLALAFCLRFSSCADDNEIFPEGGFASVNVYFADGLLLSWAAPRYFSDATALDPLWDLDIYEIYINRTGMFFPDDEPSAYVSAIDSSGIANEEFDLALLGYPFQLGQTYHVSMRSVSKTGARSEFSTVFTFTLQDGANPSQSTNQFICRTPPVIFVAKHQA